MSEKILFYTPYGMWYLHTLYEQTIAHGLKLRDAEYKFVGCDALFKDCDVATDSAAPRTPATCKACTQYHRGVFNQLQMETSWLNEYLNPSDYLEVEKWTKTLTDEEALLNAEFHKKPLGKWVKSSVHTFFRMKKLEFDNQRLVEVYQNFLEGSALVLLAFNKIWAEFQPTVLFMLNGRFFTHRTVFELAQEKGVRIITHERGRIDDSIILLENETTMTFNTLMNVWNQWKQIPLNQSELENIDHIISQRELGKNTGWRSYIKDSHQKYDELIKALRIDGTKKIISLFTSSEDESADSPAWKPELIDQIEWIKQTIEYFRKKPEYILVIRLHPNTSHYIGTNHQFLKNFEPLRKNLPGNVRIIESKSSLNTYRLIEMSEKVISFFSTITIEAPLRGKPTLACARGFFYGFNFTENLKDGETYSDKLDQFIQSQSQIDASQLCEALRYAYTYFIRISIQFPLVSWRDVHHAKINYSSLEELLPGKDKALDHICNAIINRTPVYLSPNSVSGNEDDENKYIEKIIKRNEELNLQLKNLLKKIENNLSNKYSQPAVSVVIPCYNYGDYLRECVESVIQQTYKDFEIIIVNDGSPDNTKEIAEQLIAEYPAENIVLINQENTGQPAIARNNGIREAKGIYILPLDADDKLDPTFLEKTVSVLERRPDIDMVYTDRMDFGKISGVVQALDFNPQLLPYQNHMSYCTLYRREVWDEVGGYRENVRAVEDWDFFVAASVLGKKGYRIPEPLFLYRNNETGLYQEAVQNAAQKHAQIMLNNPKAYKPVELDNARRKLIGQPTDPLVSVIIPTYNRPDLLRQAVRSVLAQTYRNLEILVINDAGEDVEDVIKDMADDRLRYIRHEQNKGLAATRNTGLQNASGKYIAYLDDDDQLYPNHLSLLVTFLENHPYSVVYADAYQVTYDADGKVLDKSVVLSYDYNVDLLLVRNITPVQGVVHERDCIKKAGLFDESLKTHEDWDFWIRLSQFYPFYHIKQVTSEFRRDVYQHTMTSERRFDFYRSMEQIHRKYGHLAFDKSRVNSAQQAERNALKNMLQGLVIKQIESMKKNQPQQSIEEQENMYKNLIAQAPFLGFGYNQLGTLYFHQDPAKAKELFQKAIEMEPEQIKYHMNYIHSLAKLGDTENAQRMLRELIDKHPDNQSLEELSIQLQKHTAQQNLPTNELRKIPNQGSSKKVVSIIMPVYNKMELTQKCLDSIFKHTAENEFEIIIVDNASTDNTEEILGKWANKEKRIRYIRNEKNWGFAKACNQGAQLAESDLLLFLNNDMEVQPNWLQPLLNEFQNENNVGIAGSLLLHPNKTVQHNGIIIINDRLMNHPLSPWHYQINLPLEQADLNRRKVKGVTGACLMIKKALFEEVDGFDEKFYNGYEDVDLNYKVLLKGYDIVVVPDSQIIHYESKSGEERFKMEKENFSRLKQKWNGMLTAEYVRIDPDKIELYNDTSIIIVTYNSEKTLKSCLESVLATIRPRDEIILVDNASKDGTVELARSIIGSDSRCKIIELENNVGFTRGTNIGIEHSNNPYVAFLNPDTIVTDKWLDKLIRALWDYKHAAVGPVSNYAAGLQNADAHIKESLSKNMTIAQIGAKFEQWHGQNVIESRLLTGFCLIIRRDVLKRLGLLDERLFLGNDDLELSWRLRVNGFKLMVHPGTFIYHEGQVSFKTDQKSVTDELVQQSTDELMRILTEHYGKGHVPTPEEIWGMNWFKPSHPEFNPRSKLMDVKSLPNLSINGNKPESKPNVSIVILTYNQLSMTKQCLHSIYLNTNVSFELIIVDNASTDGTVNYLKNLKNQHDDIHLILNSKNLGFPHGCNQGMKIATGNYILLLNNDVVVSGQWLEPMLKAFEKDPRLGIVGPVTNAVSGPQMLQEVDYSDLEGMEIFAQKIRENNKGKLMYFPRIVGFAMLMKREVYEKLGPMEESFGSGNYEDDDYCLRAELAGYKAAIVLDSFVHHYGSASFRAEGANAYLNNLQKNADLFYEKWKGLKQPADMWFIYLLSRARDEKAKNNIEKALSFYQEAFRVRNDDKSMVEEYAKLLKEMGEYERLLSVMDTYCRTVTDDDAWNYLGSLYWQSGNAEKARDAFQKAVEIMPSNLTYLQNLAEAEYMSENFEKAIQLFSIILQNDGRNVESALKLAHIFLEAGNKNRAEEILSQVYETTNNSEIKHYINLLEKPALYLAYSFVKQGNLEYAFEYINQYLQQQPQDTEAKLLRASILMNINQLDSALSEYSAMVEENSENDEAIYYVMEIMMQLEKATELKEFCQQYFQVINASPDLLAKKIEAFLNVGLQNEGLQAIDDYLGLFPSDYYGYFVMGKIYEQSGDTDKAAVFYHKTMECQPPEEILQHVQSFINSIKAD